MGGVPLPPSAETVLLALQQHASGNPLELHRIVHSLSRPVPDVLPQLLGALTHLTSHLHAQLPTSQPFRMLVDAALSLDVAPHINPNTQAQPILSAFTEFLANLISVDAAYVDPVLNLIATSFFFLEVGHAEIVAPSLDALISLMLATHPRSSELLAANVCRKFPHPVRPLNEHVSYLRAAFRTVKAAQNPHFTRMVVTVAIERLSAIEALVPANALEHKCVAQGESEDVCLTPPAEKLQAVMLELLRFIDSTATSSKYASSLFRPLLLAYESHIVPVEANRFSPFVLIHAASRLGSAGIAQVIERFRTSFFDSSISVRLRECYLEHSAAILVHSSMVTTAQASNWLSRLACWLNGHVDAVERGMVSDNMDSDLHRLFYTGCAVLMSVVKHRRDTIRSEAIAQMRLVRILSSSLNALSILPQELVDDFISLLGGITGVDLRETAFCAPNKFAPPRKKLNGKNKSILSIRPEFVLPKVQERLKTFEQGEECGTTRERPRKRARVAEIQEQRSSPGIRLLLDNVNLEVSS